jgi:hypothetical protein
MQKLLFLLFFCCLSANVNAQKTIADAEIDTFALIQKTLVHYTEPAFLDTLKGEQTEAVTTIFYTKMHSDSILRNAFVWNSNEKTLAYQDIDLRKVKMQNGLYNLQLVEVKKENDNIGINFKTACDNPPASTKWVKKRAFNCCGAVNPEDCFTWCLVEIHITNCGITQKDDNGFYYNANIPISCSLLDAVFKYNTSTATYEMQPFARQNERRDWYAKRFLKTKTIRQEPQSIRVQKTACFGGNAR